MIASLIFLIGVQLVARASASETLVSHGQLAEELSGAGIKAKLSTVTWEDKEHPTDIVVGLLYRAKNKESNSVLDDLTVARLIAQNQIDISGCSKEALKQRMAVVSSVPIKEYQSGLIYAVRSYLLDTLARAARFCVRNQEQVVAAGVNQEEYLVNLGIAISFDSFDDGSKGDEALWSSEIAHNGFVSNIGKFIETESLEL